MQTFLKPDWAKLIVLAVLIFATGIPCYLTPYVLERNRPYDSPLTAAELAEALPPNAVLIFTPQQAIEAGLTPPPPGQAYRKMRERKGFWTPGAGIPGTLAFADAIKYRFSWMLILPWLAALYLTTAASVMIYRQVYGGPGWRTRPAWWGFWLVLAAWMWFKLLTLLQLLYFSPPAFHWWAKLLALMSPTVALSLTAALLGIKGYRQKDRPAGVLTAALGSLTALAAMTLIAFAIALTPLASFG